MRRPRKDPRVEQHEREHEQIARSIVNQAAPPHHRDPAIAPRPPPAPGRSVPATIGPTWSQGPALDAHHAEAVEIAQANWWRR